jgi:hypothetical protein
MTFRLTLLFVLLVFLPRLASGQKLGIKGRILDQNGKPIPFATIGLEKSPSGTMANEEGFYKLELTKGSHVVYFQCLGFKTERKSVEVASGFDNLDVVLQEQLLQTREVVIASQNEDPAYAIMRKAITRAKINKMLVDAYTAEVYIRGSGRILDLPFLLRPLMKKEGIDANTVMFKETLESIQFKQPNTYVEKVLASRSTFGKLEVKQNFLKYELYSPNFGQTISPLSPSAFRYYRFQYLGAFSESGHEVFKIKVIPRTEGQHIWKGELFLIDKLWCIHSARLSENAEGFDIQMTQQYAPVEGIWLPLQIRQDIKGKAIGITMEAVYNATIRKYKITKNEKLYADFQKLEQQLDEKTDEVIRLNPEKPDLKKREKEERKMVRQLARAYVKDKFKIAKKNRSKSEPAASVVANRVFIEDSSSIRNDSTFWEENRLVPLTQLEQKSYRKLDSLWKVSESRDSSRKKRKAFSFVGNYLLVGKQYSFGRSDSLKRKPWSLKLFSPYLSICYNSVEGYSIEPQIWLKKYFGQSRNRFRDDRNFIQFGPSFRYAYGREKLLMSGVFQYGSPKWMVQASGGSGIRQFSSADPISKNLNLLYCFYTGTNYMKVYQSDYLKLDFLRKLSGRLEFEIGLGFEDRSLLRNSFLKNIFGKVRNFESNQESVPSAPGLEKTGNRMADIHVGMDWYPFMTSALYNESQYFRMGNSPRIRFELTHAIPQILDSKADFTKLEISLRQSIGILRNTKLELSGRVGAFVRKVYVGQMDALHIVGNRTNVIGGQSIDQFRNLDYYSSSSADRLAEVHAHLFRDRILLGWLFPTSKNWREVLLFNALAIPEGKQFSEFGYGVDRLFRFVHLEVVHSQWNNAKPAWRFMLGASYSFSVRPRNYDKSVDPTDRD